MSAQSVVRKLQKIGMYEADALLKKIVMNFDGYI